MDEIGNPWQLHTIPFMRYKYGTNQMLKALKKSTYTNVMNDSMDIKDLVDFFESNICICHMDWFTALTFRN